MVEALLKVVQIGPDFDEETGMNMATPEAVNLLLSEARCALWDQNSRCFLLACSGSRCFARLITSFRAFEGREFGQ